ncbi:MAG: MotA/TolQ/ExbB proton channel family protein [Planctomycetota bacterium]
MNVITRFYQLGRVSRFSIFCLFVLALMSINSFGQESVPVDASQIRDLMDEAPAEPAAESTPSGIDLLTLITRGGAFMIPIGIMSMLVVTLAFERLVMLRRRMILPPQLERELRRLNSPSDHFDPAEAFQSCRHHASASARVIHSMLMRTGQPLGEIERAANETIEREADRCAGPIRWLTLAAAATPLMGLLGTVWGMIVAFHESTTLTPDRTRSEQLSEGIYTALVTTLAGLVVAIPAAILALYLENRLSKLFHRVEEFAFEIAPGLERFTGRKRLDASGVLHPLEGSTSTSTSDSLAPTPPPPPPARATHGDVRAG